MKGGIPMTIFKRYFGPAMLFALLLTIRSNSPGGFMPVLFALVLWTVIGGTSLIYKALLGRRNRVDAKLATTLALDTAKLAAVVTPDVDWKSVRLACLKKMYKTKSYCSRMVLQDFLNDKLSAPDFIWANFRVDYVGPDRWHVTQQGVDRDARVVWDGWISIGSRNYQHIGMWVQTADNHNDIQNLKLSIGALLSIVTEQTPVTIQLYRRHRTVYVVARYSWIAVKASVSRYWGVNADEADMGMGELDVWIDVRTSAIIKGEISAHDGPRKVGTISQAFACFDENIKVTEPPWLNGVLNRSGAYTVLDSRVAAMPHHR